MKGFIDFHSFAQLWMSPWGYTKKLPPDFKDQVRILTTEQTIWKTNMLSRSTNIKFKKEGIALLCTAKNVNNQDIKQTIIVLVAPGV